jgi:hypothetical protein
MSILSHFTSGDGGTGNALVMTKPAGFPGTLSIARRTPVPLTSVVAIAAPGVGRVRMIPPPCVEPSATVRTSRFPPTVVETVESRNVAIVARSLADRDGDHHLRFRPAQKRGVSGHIWICNQPRPQLPDVSSDVGRAHQSSGMWVASFDCTEGPTKPQTHQ